MIEKLLKNKSAKQRAKIKSQELAKIKLSKFKKDGFDIEIVGDIKNVDNHIEFYAKAWKDGKQLGFGKKGDVEVERFIIHNPPVLVDDSNGNIVREWTDEKGELKQRKLKYDPAQALKNSLAHTISLIAKDGKDIVKGKVGNTTSTFYSNENGDGGIQSVSGSWNTAHDASSGNAFGNRIGVLSYASGDYYIKRGFLPFDTSALGDTDTIDSAILSIYVSGTQDSDNDGNDFISIIQTNQPSPTALAYVDYNNCGTIDNPTEGVDAGQRKDITSIATSAYLDFTLNATGLGWISKTGYSKFGFREGHDILDNAVQNFGGSEHTSIDMYFAEHEGTDNDPKLVVVHSSVTTDNSVFFGCNF